MLPKLWAFFKRDWQLASALQFNFLFGLLRTVASLVSFFFIGKLFLGGWTPPSLAAYGGDYFRFVFLGLAFSGLVTTALGSMKQTIGFELGSGTLEAILLTPTPLTVLMVEKVLWDLALLLGKIAIYFLIGILLFRIDFSQANWAAAFLVFILTTVAFLGLGIFSAGFFLLTKGATPVDLIFDWGSRFLAGVYFPTVILPGWLQRVSAYLPLTYTLEAIRKCVIGGASLAAIQKELMVLLGFALILFPGSFFFFNWAFDQSRRRGNFF